MEWIGWYFEFKAYKLLKTKCGGDRGPKYGRTQFDYRLKNVWDFKAHPTNGSSTSSIIINDKEAVDRCIAQYGGLGVVIAIGAADYDTDGGFKAWHDGLKGGISDYERARKARSAPSRIRKIAFNLLEYLFLWLEGETIRDGLRGGWISLFQQGMRNADGSPRRAKYQVNLDRVPTSAVILKGNP